MLLRTRDGIDLPDGHLLDVMVKRLHEYKRQTLKLLHLVTLYDQIISGRGGHRGRHAAHLRLRRQGRARLPDGQGDDRPDQPRGRRSINNDPRVEGRLSVAFPANYNVTLAEKLIPAADLSEQISLAGKEASGTGNMKFALNGALTIGTDDGANVEIRELVGDDNFFLFGLVEPEVGRTARDRATARARYYESDPDLRRAIDLIASGAFSGGDRHVFEPIVSQPAVRGPVPGARRLPGLHRRAGQVDAAYADTEAWTRSAILNVARSGSSPRTARCATTSTASGTPRRPSERTHRRSRAGSPAGLGPRRLRGWCSTSEVEFG